MNNNRNPVLTLEDLGLSISIWFDRYDGDRCQYGYRIVGADHREGDPIYAEGTDLRSPGEPDLADAMRTLCSFWSAAIESYNYTPRGENADLFPEALLELGIDADEVAYAASWLGGEES